MTEEFIPADYIYDWNVVGVPPNSSAPLRVELLDETLRDGLQSPSLIDPPMSDKLELLRLMDRLGIAVADLGLPGAGARMVAQVTGLCEVIRDEKLTIRAAAAARTLAADIQPVIDISRSTGVEIEILAFLGASPIRLYAENWDIDRMRTLTRDAVRLGVRAGLPVAFVTEDTVRASPAVLETLFKTAIDEGAHRLVLCDTVGHATPTGVRRLVEWTRELLAKMGVTLGIDFHGHNDRGLALANSLAAIRAGCDRVHGTALGIGERVGNTSIDQLVVNLLLCGFFDHNVADLVAYCRRASVATGRRIPQNYPVIGNDAFRTATGVHASAIVKARKRGSDTMADHIYSGVPAAMVGRSQAIMIGHLSGESNVLAWLDANGFAPNPAVVAEIYRAAKQSHRILADNEISKIVERVVGPA
ncbi:MAG: 2-isopropylmalate synthase [Myxococcota bacterium]|jgi:2-isopropylmalate synthase